MELSRLLYRLLLVPLALVLWLANERSLIYVYYISIPLNKLNRVEKFRMTCSVISIHSVDS